MDAVGGSWAGSLACSICRKKRLTAESFSANQLRQLRDRKMTEDQLKCKDCVSSAAAAERQRLVINSHLILYQVVISCVRHVSPFSKGQTSLWGHRV